MKRIASLLLVPLLASAAFAAERLTVTTWNTAAVNDNPFEYWITWNENPEYEKLMLGVEKLLSDEDPGTDVDALVSSIFTEEMFDELEYRFQEVGWGSVRSYWEDDFRNRKIITEFLKDRDLMLKRLPTMTNRYTNTIRVEGDAGTAAYRPTVTNAYPGDLSSLDEWWQAWKTFMFEDKLKVKTLTGAVEEKVPFELLKVIRRAKYPSITEQEEADSLPLQTLCCAIYDAMWVHIMNSLSEDPNTWQSIRQTLVQALIKDKISHSLKILETEYLESDIITLQEVSSSFLDQARESPVLGEAFHVVAPIVMDVIRDMNSVILLNKKTFPLGATKEITELVYGSGKGARMALGDLLVITTTSKDNVPFVVASFHGDTNGLGTIPVVEGIVQVMGSDEDLVSRRLVFGLDANVYEHPKPNREVGVSEFSEAVREHGMNSCWGYSPNPSNYTTYSARTYVQDPLNLKKACKFEERQENGDINPKDFILFAHDQFSVVKTWKDNTGKREYIEGMAFPTLDFPSDHGIVATILEASGSGDESEG